MPNYTVTWTFDAEDVANPVEAARQAWAALHADDTIANVFRVTKHHGLVATERTVDLEAIADGIACDRCGSGFRGEQRSCVDCPEPAA